MTEAPASPSSTPQSKPARPKRWRRRLLFLAVGLLVLLALAPLAVSLGPVRSMIADKVGAKLDRKVEIGGASAYWFSGIDLEDITVHSPKGFDGPLATVHKIHADVDLLATLFGTPKASVRVVQPHVTFRRNAAGVSNADGVAEALQGDDEDKDTDTSGGKADIQVAVIGGKVESIGRGGAADAALHELDVGLALRPSGDLGLDVRAVAAGAGLDGRAARIVAKADVLADGSTPFEIDVPGLDLARLAALIQDTTGIHDVQGQLEVTGKGTRTAAGTYEGTLHAKATALRARSGGGVTFSLQRMLAGATMKAADEATEFDANVQVGDLRIEDPALGGRPYREPSITLSAQGLLHPKGWLRVAKAHVDAGQTVKVSVPEMFMLQLDPEVRFDGQLGIEADLERIGTWRSIVPALEPLGGGRLDAQVRGRGDRALEVGIGATITNLSLRPGEAFPQGYTEPQIGLTLNVSHAKSSGTTVRVYKLASRLVNVSTRNAKDGVAFGLDAQDRIWLEGGFDGNVDLPSLSRLLAGRLPLEPGERLDGTIAFGGEGRGQGDSMQATTRIQMRGVRVPPSWSTVREPADLTATIALNRARGSTTAELKDLAGMGLGGALTARLREGEGETALDEAEGQISLDLGRARSWLGALLGLEAQARLGGVARSRLRLAEEGVGRRLDATVQITNLLLQASPESGRLQEPRVVLRANAWLAPEGERHRADELKLSSNTLTLDASGSTYVGAPDEDMDVSIQLGGDAAGLAPTIAAFLGEGYEDLRGEGRLGGSLSLSGSSADNARNLRAEGNLILGSWSSNGLQVGDLKSTLGRASEEEPLSLGVTSKLNGGRVFAQAALTLGREALPWEGHVDMSDVDTAGVITSRGIGRMLAFALPALLPAGANVPVLSGRLTARVEAEAPSMEDPAMLDGLTGRGRVSMAQGEIRNSTLFGGGGDGGNLGRVIQGLKVAVPDAGRVLEEATKALTFSALESKFHIERRIVYVDRALLTGRALDVDMKGTVDFDQRVALDSKLQFKGKDAANVGKFLPGGAVPLRVAGTLASPQVQPNVDMKSLLAGAVGDPKDLLERLKKQKLPKIKNPFK